MLAGFDDRLSVALRLANELRSTTLVVSRGKDGYGGPCPTGVRSGVRRICFGAGPRDTPGRAGGSVGLAREGNRTAGGRGTATALTPPAPPPRVPSVPTPHQCL